MQPTIPNLTLRRAFDKASRVAADTRLLSNMGNKAYEEHSVGPHLLSDGDTVERFQINFSTEQPLCTNRYCG